MRKEQGIAPLLLPLIRSGCYELVRQARQTCATGARIRRRIRGEPNHGIFHRAESLGAGGVQSDWPSRRLIRRGSARYGEDEAALARRSRRGRQVLVDQA